MTGNEKATGDAAVSEPSVTEVPKESGKAEEVRAAENTSARFDPSRLDRRIITIPLAKQIERQEKSDPGSLYKVIIDLNLNYHGGRDGAREKILQLLNGILGEGPSVGPTGASIPQPVVTPPPSPVAPPPDPLTSPSPAPGGTRSNSSGEGINSVKSDFSDQYLFGRFTAKTLVALVTLDKTPVDPAAAPAGNAPISSSVRRAQNAIYLIWPDFAIAARLTKSVSTVKADAARLSFSANGSGIVWAILDSGIQGDHIHFDLHKNLAVTTPLAHLDFTVIGNPAEGKPLEDPCGHGTHVAGIVAGELIASPDRPILAISRQQEQDADPEYHRIGDIETITGVAPRCRLLSLRVLDESGNGDVSSLIAAIGYIQQLNGDGRHLLIHGVNISAGYQFYPEWFACGQSPVCVEVDRLVKSGVVVVVAAGNTGYAYEQVFTAQSAGAGSAIAGQSLSINDPGNAELAITVGSTHREMPHTYGVSYFSSKGPTGDGRCKPDLVAPGEKIISCAAGATRAERLAHVADPGKGCDYAEDTGTSMASPHVSGVIAAFLSVRREYIGRPEEVKQIFMSAATDLGRDRYFQGKGLVDLMRAIQSV